MCCMLVAHFFFISFVNLLIKKIFSVALFILSLLYTSFLMQRCVHSHGLLFMLLFVHIKLKPLKKKRHSNLTGYLSTKALWLSVRQII